MIRKIGFFTAIAFVAAALGIILLVAGCKTTSDQKETTANSGHQDSGNGGSLDSNSSMSDKDTGEGHGAEADGPPESRQGAHDISREQIHEAMLQVLDGVLTLEKVTTSTDILGDVLARKALDQYQEAIKTDIRSGRYKVRDFQDIKLRFRNYSGGVSGITLEYKDNSYYADLKTAKPLTEKTMEVRRLLLSVQEIDERWKIMAFFEPVKKPSAEQLKDSTTTSVPEAVKIIEKELGYN